MLIRSEKPAIDNTDRDWRQVLKQAWKKPAELLNYLQLDTRLLDDIEAGQREFPLLAPPAFVGQIEKGNPLDPLFLQIFPQAAEGQKQIFPQAAEGQKQIGLLKDPVGDLNSQVNPGFLHKYRSRALLITTGACAIHCRYCFRRHFPYSSVSGSRLNWGQTLDYIQRHPEITEIILSGGDPLMLPTTQLHNISAQLASLEQIKTLRIHSRMATTLPERINSGLLSWLSDLPFRLVLVHHINHPNEIGEAAKAAISKLTSTIQQQLNQTVLLKGINNELSTLVNLSELLFTNNILPYYLHQMDPVESAGHFICSDREALDLFIKLRGHLPGYLLPKMVRECAGQSSKTPV